MAKHPKISEADKRLWRRVADRVTPLHPEPCVEPTTPSEPAQPDPKEPAKKDKPKPRPQSPSQPVRQRQAPPSPDLEPGRQAPDLDRRSADRLRRGRMPIDARIDLHGMTRASAQDALYGFLDRAHGRGHRCVLVITGKGTGGGGVLRRELPLWLNESRLRPLVLSIQPAQPRHGGGGAFYVLLRRQRDRRP